MDKRVIMFSLRGPSNENIIGGAREYLLNFARVLNNAGYDVVIVCGDEQGFVLPDFEKLENSIEVHRIKYKNPFIAFKKYYNKKLKKKNDLLIENIVSFPLFCNADIAIIHHLPGSEYIRSKGAIIGGFGLFLEYCGLPVVYRTKKIITVSQFSKSEIISRGIKDKSITVIPPIVRFKKFVPKNISVKRDNIILYIGRYDGVSGVKRVDHIIEIMPDIIKKIPDAKLIIGGSMRKRDELEKLALDLKVEKNIEFRGFISEKEKYYLMSIAKIFVSPSYQEGFGITFIEANSCGTPIIGYEINGLDTVPGNAGLFAKQNDKNGLLIRILKLLSDNQIWKEYSLGALENAKRFDSSLTENSIRKFMEDVNE